MDSHIVIYEYDISNDSIGQVIAFTSVSGDSWSEIASGIPAGDYIVRYLSSQPVVMEAGWSVEDTDQALAGEPGGNIDVEGMIERMDTIIEKLDALNGDMLESLEPIGVVAAFLQENSVILYLVVIASVSVLILRFLYNVVQKFMI